MAVSNINVLITATVAPLSRALREASRELDTFGRGMLRLNSRVFYQAQQAGYAMVAIGAAGGAGLYLAAKAAVDLEAEMRNVATISTSVQANFQKSTDAVVAMTRDLPQSATDLARGLYDIESSGFHGAAALDVLKASGQAAAAGLTETRTAARAITAVLNAYGPAVGTAAYVSDVLFQTVNVGVVTFEELAQHLGNFIGITSQVGVSIEEVGGAFATMTRAGLPAAEASTSLARAMTGFIKPSEEMISTVKQLGYETPYAMVQALGLKKSIETLTKATGGSVPAISRLFKEQRGLRGVLALTSQEGRLYNEVMTTFDDKSKIAGSTVRALTQQEKSAAHQLKLLRNAATEVAISIGQSLLPAIKFVAGALRSLLTGFQSLPGWMRTAIVVAGILATTMIGFAGALILIAPRIVATKAAIASMALTMPRLAQGVNFATAALGLFSKALGIASLILAAAMAIDFLANKITDISKGKTNLPEFARDLVTFAQGGRLAGEVVKQFGSGLDDLRQKLRDAGKNEWTTISIGELTRVKDAKRDIDALDKSLAQLVTEGHADVAAVALKRIAEEGGVPIGELKKRLNDYKNALAEADRQGKLNGGTMQDQAANAEALVRTQEELNAVTKEYEERLKGITSALDSFRSYSDAIGEIQDRQKRAAEDATKEKKGIDEITEALNEQNRARLNGERAQKRINRLLYITNGMPVPGSDADLDLKDARLDLAEANAKLAKSSEDAQTAEQKHQGQLQSEKVSLVDFRTELQRQIGAQLAWERNLAAVAKRAGRLGIGQLVIDEFTKMGKEGAPLLEQLANTTDKEFVITAKTIEEHAGRGGDDYARALDLMLNTGRIAAKQGASATVDTVLAELNRLIPGIGALRPEVAEAAKSVGVAIGDGMIKGLREGLRLVAEELQRPQDALNILGPGMTKIQTDLLQRQAQLRQITGALGGTTATVAPVTSNITSAPTATPETIKTFQRSINLAAGSQVIVVDGILGPATYAAATKYDIHLRINGVQVAADGMISNLPQQATIQSPVGSRGLVQWAEPETGGEAFIPLASGKRERSTALLGEVAGMFGYGLTPYATGGYGGLTPEEMKRYGIKPVDWSNYRPIWDTSPTVTTRTGQRLPVPTPTSGRNPFAPPPGAPVQPPPPPPPDPNVALMANRLGEIANILRQLVPVIQQVGATTARASTVLRPTTVRMASGGVTGRPTATRPWGRSMSPRASEPPRVIVVEKDSSSVTKKNITNFTGPMYMSDPAETLRYAERKKRLTALARL